MTFVQIAVKWNNCIRKCTMSKDKLVIDVYNDGKYKFIIKEDDWRIHVLRYGEPWMIIEEGHNAIALLMQEVEELREKVLQLSGGSKSEPKIVLKYGIIQNPSNGSLEGQWRVVKNDPKMSSLKGGDSK